MSIRVRPKSGIEVIRCPARHEARALHSDGAAALDSQKTFAQIRHPACARIFSTVVHRLAQASRANLVDAADGKIYFAGRLNRKIEDLTVRLGFSEFLNVFAILSVTGKLEDFTRRRRLRKSLTAIAESS